MQISTRDTLPYVSPLPWSSELPPPPPTEAVAPAVFATWPPVGVRMGGATHTGLVRSRNEDAFALLPEHGAAIVADGMGGRQGGAEAAAFAVDTLRAHVLAAAPHGPPSAEVLEHAVLAANARIHGAAANEPDLWGMGTTIAGVWAHGSRACIAHVGDTRIYLLRAGTLERLTEDHTLAADYVRKGIFTPDQASRARQRNSLTRALGLHPEVAVETRVIALRRGDRLLVCSDGLTSELGDEDVGRVLGSEQAPGATAEALIRQALRGGGRDNVTAVVLDIAR
jgi:protein phosphatase